MAEFVRKSKDLNKVKNITKEVEEDVDILISEAAREGYESVLEYTKAKFKAFDREAKQEVLSEVYEGFLIAVQNRELKDPWGKGEWGSDSTFIEYVSYCLKETTSRIDETKWKFDTQYPSFAGLVKYLPDMKNTPPGIGKGMSREDYDFYMLLLRKCKELYEECLKNPEIISGLLMLQYESKGK